MNLIKQLALLIIILAAFMGNVSAKEEQTTWNDEQLKIIELTRWLALAPKEAGFDVYAALFHPDYTNWYMAGDKSTLRNRAQYLALVKKWLDAGNHATESEVETISVDVFNDIAYVRQIKKEQFYHPDKTPTKFEGHFASLLKKHNGKWTFFRTSFDTRFRGPIDATPTTVTQTK